MPSTVQPDLFALPAAKAPSAAPGVARPRWRRPKVSADDIARLVARLRGRGWVTRGELGMDDRQVKLIKEASHGAILGSPGSTGYRLFDEASAAEWDRADIALTSQINAMIRTRTAYRRRRQRVERSRLP